MGQTFQGRVLCVIHRGQYLWGLIGLDELRIIYKDVKARPDN